MILCIRFRSRWINVDSEVDGWAGVLTKIAYSVIWVYLAIICSEYTLLSNGFTSVFLAHSNDMSSIRTFGIKKRAAHQYSRLVIRGKAFALIMPSYHIDGEKVISSFHNRFHSLDIILCLPYLSVERSRSLVEGISPSFNSVLSRYIRVAYDS